MRRTLIEFQVMYVTLFGVIDGFEWFWMGSIHKNIQLAGVLQGSSLGPTLFLLYINDLLDDTICNIAIYADDTSIYSECDQVFDLRQQLELTSDFESDLRDTVYSGRK